MEDFRIKTRLTKKEYTKIMLVGVYKRPAFILTTIFGLFLITTVLLNYFNVIVFYNDTPLIEIASGIFFLFAPIFIVIIAVRQFTSNPNFQTDINYTFGDSGVTVEGSTFKSELKWPHIIKQKELGKFLILYHDKRFGNFIDKTKLTKEELEFIILKVEHK